MDTQYKKIVIDAMGGDYAPEAPVAGTLLALQKYPNLSGVCFAALWNRTMLPG